MQTGTEGGPREATGKGGHLQAGRGASGGAGSALVLDFWPPELGDHPFLLSKSPPVAPC